MRKLKLLLLLALPMVFILESCGLSSSKGQLTGVQGRKPWYHPQPYGTVYIPSGTFHMGQSDEDVLYSLTSRPKQVTIKSFFMDETEITNNQYRQFIHHVRDSIAKTLLGGNHIKDEGEETERLNWREKIRYDDQETVELLAEMFYQGDDKLVAEPVLNPDMVVYNYKWFDLQEAAKRKYIANPQPRSSFIREENVRIFPDTLAFIRDFTYSFNDPMTEEYFNHPAYDDYPVVGVNWPQANAFAHWRTDYLNSYYKTIGEPTVSKFRLPTEAEWEYAARGGRDHNPYPWGGPYTRNHKGCFLANFKPLRGNYIADGGFYPVKVTSYFPNDYGLYCMAGNAAEWTSSAYDEALMTFIDDMNPNYYYDAKEDDDVTLKRKVVKGGSWKDVAYYLQNGVRAYEYADTAKSYIGFRTVQSYMGRSIEDR